MGGLTKSNTQLTKKNEGITSLGGLTVGDGFVDDSYERLLENENFRLLENSEERILESA